MKHIVFAIGIIALLITSCDNSKGKAVDQSKPVDERKAKSTADSIIAHMVLVDGGTFVMGSDDYEHDYQIVESPAHKVTLSPFHICKYEVTQKEWETIMGENPSTFQDESPNNPVETVSWLDCQVFIKRLNEISGKKFRLPTEAEWEFAARGGNKSHGYKFSGSDDHNEMGCIYTPFEQATQEVGLLKPNELGLYDMSGNVNEYCSNVFEEYTAEDQVDPKGTNGLSKYRVARGGGWCNARRNCTVTTRLKISKDHRPNGVGLRLAMDANAARKT